MQKMLTMVVGALLAGQAMAELPPLFGDGVHDDTAAIQARLDAGSSCVYLPPPAKEYLISTTLVIRSSTELKLDRFTHVRLAPQSDCPLLENAGYRADGGTDVCIAVTGGIWDMDNLRQSPNPWVDKEARARRPKAHDPDYFIGIAMRFCHVRGISVCGITIRNPTTYGVEFGHVSNFLVNDITFDYQTWNPVPLNLDGVHLDGFCHHGRISNLRGTCFDDMVALNANDGICSPEEGPISDIDIDGLYSDYTHRGVRILSAGAPIRRVTVRNVHIRTYRNAVAIAHFFRDRKEHGDFDEIVIRDIQSSATYEPDGLDHSGFAWPLVWVENNCEVGHLVIDNLSRTETWRAAHPTIGIDPGATVEHLVISNCRQVNETKDDMVFLVNRGKVANLELGTVSLKSVPGAGRSILRDDTAACGRIFPNFTPNVRPKEK